MVSPAEIRRARAYLQAKGLRRTISPKTFAGAAKEMDVGFAELLKFIGRLYSGGQDQAGRIRELIQTEVSGKG